MLALSVSAALGGPFIPYARAASTDTWAGSAGSTDWITNGNWLYSSGNGPVAAGDSLVFTSANASPSATLTNSLSDGNFSINGITFNPGAPAYTMTGNAFALAANSAITNNSTTLQTFANQINLQGNASFNTVSGGDLFFSGVVGGAGPLSVGGGGNVTLTSAPTYTGNTSITGGTLQLGNGTAPTSLTNSGNYNIAANARLFLNEGAYSAPAWANITGAGTLELSTTTANAAVTNAALPTSFTGTLVVDSGARIDTAGNATFGASNATIQINSGAEIIVRGNLTQNLIISGNGDAADAPIGAIQIADSGAPSERAISGNIQIVGSAAIGTFAANDSILTAFTGNISGPSSATLTVSCPDGGTTPYLAFSGANQFAGSVVLASGTLRLRNHAALQNATVVQNGGNISFSGLELSNAFTFGALAGGAPVTLVSIIPNQTTPQVLTLTNGSTAITLTVGTNNSSTSYFGNINGTGNLIKVGTGTLSLEGNSGYSGSTTVSGGTLRVDSFLSTGAVGITGATLLLDGTLSSAVNVTLANGTLAGNGNITAQFLTGSGQITPHDLSGNIGLLHLTGNIALSSGTSFSYRLGGSPGSGSDLITASGNVTLGSGADVLNLTSLPGFGVGSYNLITATGNGTVTDNGNFTVNGSPGFNYAVGASGKSLALSVSYTNPVLNWTGAAGGAGNGSWDTSTQNWTTGSNPTAYSELSPVVFDGGSLSTSPPGATNISVQSGGVNPVSIVVNSPSAYTFGGGPINCVASLAIASSGGVTLNNNVSAGTMVTVTGSQLNVNGSLTTPMLLLQGNGTLNVGQSGSLSSNAAVSVPDASAINFGNANQTVYSLSTNGPVSLNGTALTAGNGTGGGGTINGLISGNGSFAVGANAKVILPASNSYGGGTAIGAGATLQLGTGGLVGSVNGPITDNGTLVFNRSDAQLVLSQQISGSGGVTWAGNGTMTIVGSNAYSGGTTTLGGNLILSATNSGASLLTATNSVSGGTTLARVNNSGALGNGSTNSQLGGIYLNATGGGLSSAILDLAAPIGTDPTGHGYDLTYQVINASVYANNNANPILPTPVPANGQILLGAMTDIYDGVGFAAIGASPRYVALLTPTTGSTALAILQEKSTFGEGGGDHLTLGSADATNTLVLMNEIDLNGGATRGFQSIRGTGNVPEGEYGAVIINSTPPNIGVSTIDNISFNGNGGLIFDSPNSSYQVATTQINNGAVYIASSDPAASGQTGPLGEGNATLQVGSAQSPAVFVTAPSSNIAFLLYGNGTVTSPGSSSNLNQGVGASPTIFTNRPIAIGGGNITYASATLGIASDDYGAYNGSIQLNEVATTPTTFLARDGGRVDFNGNISGIGSVVVGNATVEGDSASPGIAMGNNGMIVFNGTNSYQGSTTVSAGRLYVNGSVTASSSVTIGPGATLGGKGTIAVPISVSTGGTMTAGADTTHAGTLTTGNQTWTSGGFYAWKLNDNAIGGTTDGAKSDLLTMGGLTLSAPGATPFTVQMQSFGASTPTAGVAVANFAPAGTFNVANLTSVAGDSDITNAAASDGGNPFAVVLTGPLANSVSTSLFALDTTGFANNPTAGANNQAYLEFVGTGSGTAGSIDVVYNATPEPGAILLILAGGTPMLAARRRRRPVVR
jgi:autotransporter-associated beta strand protein